MGDNSDKKKIRATYFIIRNPYTCMKFQNISIICYAHESNKQPKIAKGHNSKKKNSLN